MSERPARPGRAGGLTLAVLMLAPAAPARAQIEPPPAAGDIRVVEHIGDRVPPHLRFTDARGRPVSLDDYIDGTTPIVLVLAYVGCQTLCSLVLRGVASAARQAPLTLGRDYRIVTVDIDPTETPADTSGPLRMLVNLAGGDAKRPARTWGWTFLTGEDAAIAALARSVGFGYHYDARTKQYAHPAVIIMLSGQGRVMRYLYGARYPADDFAVSITSAARGDATPTGSGETPVGCFRFDPAKRAHWGAIMRFYAIGGGVLILVLGGLVARLLIRERRRC